jgi:hypothetical protein
MVGVSFVVRSKPNFHRLLVCAAWIGLAAATASWAAQQQPSPPALPSRISPRAQDLLNQAIQALGGQAFLTYMNVTTEGRVFGFSRGEMAGVEPFKSTYAPPDKRRFTYGKGKPVTLINNGDDAWEVDQYGLTHQLPEQVRQWKIANHYNLDNLFRTIIKAPGILVLDHGVDFVANQPVYVIEIVDADQTRIQLYLQKSTYLPLRVAYRIQNPTTQDWDDYVDDYGDYQRFDGIMTPMNITRTLNGERIGEVYRNKASYNATLPANYFEPPR